MVINLTPHALLFTISAIGIAEAAYLIRVRRAAEQPICPIGGDCTTVLTSKYNRLFLGIHNDLAGLVFYIAFATVSALMVLQTGSGTLLVGLAKLMLGAATLMSLELTYLQWRVIRAWCFWCLMSAATIVVMDIIVLISQLS